MKNKAAGTAMDRRAKWGIGAVLAGVLVFLVLQFSHVWIYYDDYGYLSLSYGQVLPEARGSHYTLWQLLNYLKLHYYGANGRLLYTGLFPLCYLIGGLRMVQVVMALAVFAVHAAAAGMVLGQMHREGTHRFFDGLGPVLLTAFIGLLFGCIGLEIQNSGTYWYAASFTYVIPAVFLFFFLSLYSAASEAEEVNRKTQILCVLLAFFCAFSQEQWISALFGCLAVLWIFRLVQRRRLRGMDVLVLFAAALGAFPVLSSPAVHVRMNLGSNAEFARLSLVQKIGSNIPGIIRLFFSSQNEAYVFLLLMVMLLLGLYMLRHRIGPVILSGGFSAATAALFVYCLMNSRRVGRELGGYPELTAWLLFAYVLLMSWQILVFLYRRKTMSFMLIYLAAFFSLACLIIVPERPSRVLLPFIYLSYPVLGYLFAVLVLEAGGKFAAAALTACLAVSSLSNLSIIYRGYAVNDVVIRENDRILWESAEKLERGEPVEAIVLQHLPNEGCRNSMPYDQSMEFIVYWMSEYYHFPPDTPVIYQ